jgi:hypothetical protein
MIKNTIKLISNLKYTNYIIKTFFTNNNDLFDDNQFIKELFQSYCTNSNQDMAEYLCENNSILDNCLFDRQYYIDTLIIMSVKSTYSIVKWYVEKFNQIIDLSNTSYITESMTNQNTDVFKYILSVSKNFYSKNQCDIIFYYCVKNFYIQFVKLLYREFSDINLTILNGISLYNSIDIYTPKNIYLWLKEICDENNYEVKIVNNILIINKKIIIYQINKDILDKFNNIGINLIPDECVICFYNQTNVITNCGHKFCKECIQLWYEKNVSCPICRNLDINFKLYELNLKNTNINII